MANSFYHQFVEPFEKISLLLNLKDIKKLCLQYDKENGPHVESQYQGKALWHYIDMKINGKDESFVDDGSYRNFTKESIDEWEREIKNV